MINSPTYLACIIFLASVQAGFASRRGKWTEAGFGFCIAILAFAAWSVAL